MRRFLSISAAITLGLAVSCTNNNKTTKAKTDSVQTNTVKTDTVTSTPSNSTAKWNNVEVQVPAGWTSQDRPMNGRDLFFLIGPKESGYQTNMNILKDPMKGENLDDYIKVSLAKMQNMKVQMGQNGNMQVNGIDGRYLKYIYNAPERMIVAKSYVFAKNDTAYVVSATTIPELGKKYEPVFDRVVNSLKIK